MRSDVGVIPARQAVPMTTNPNMPAEPSTNREPLIGRMLVQTSAVNAWATSDDALIDARTTFLARCIQIHASMRWDLCDLDEHDEEANDHAVISGARVLTAHLYEEDGVREPVRIWVLTEACNGDGFRASTCVLFPEDY